MFWIWLGAHISKEYSSSIKRLELQTFLFVFIEFSVNLDRSNLLWLEFSEQGFAYEYFIIDFTTALAQNRVKSRCEIQVTRQHTIHLSL